VIVQVLFAALITLQFIAVVSHDLVDIPGWTHGSQVRKLIGQRKLWLATAINAIFPGLAVVLTFYFWNRPKSPFVENYPLIYCAVTLVSAIAMWYVPYLLGATEEKKREYALMYAGTRQVLPARGGNPRPNLLHIYFHILFALTFGLALVLRLGAV
jgi:hypothetical protein